MFKSLYYHKERLIRLSTDAYSKTLDGVWIVPLNPDNIKIYFEPMLNKKFARSCKRTVTLNSNKESNILFPYYIKELRRIKYKQDLGLKYYVYYLRIKKELDSYVVKTTHWLYTNN